MRVFHVALLGCVPVITQHDGEHPPVPQAFEPEALQWADFSVVVSHDEVDILPDVLAKVDLGAKQAALSRIWTKLVWRGALDEPLRSQMAGPDAFEMTMRALAVRLERGSPP
jgi:hypothetical protein